MTYNRTEILFKLLDPQRPFIGLNKVIKKRIIVPPQLLNAVGTHENVQFDILCLEEDILPVIYRPCLCLDVPQHILFDCGCFDDFRKTS